MDYCSASDYEEITKQLPKGLLPVENPQEIQKIYLEGLVSFLLAFIGF
jgi:hypothetical protein